MSVFCILPFDSAETNFFNFLLIQKSYEIWKSHKGQKCFLRVGTVLPGISVLQKYVSSASKSIRSFHEVFSFFLIFLLYYRKS